MRNRAAAAFVLAIASFATSTLPAAATDAPEGLELVLASTTKEAWPNGTIDWELTLANRSKTATHPVVLANDGSESGWREPHVFFTASFVGKDGVERDLQAQGVGRCGLFASAWWKDVVKLAPGATRKIEGAPVPPQATFDYQAPGKLRLVAHYVYRGGRGPARIDAEAVPEDLGGMRGVAPFELVSKPVEIEIVRPLDVVATVRGAFKAGKQMLLSDVVEARVVNRSGAPIALAPEEWTASVANDAAVHVWPVFEGAVGGAAKPITLDVGGETPCVGAKGFATQRDVKLLFQEAGRARIAVVLCRGGPRSATIRSNWVDVTIEE